MSQSNLTINVANFPPLSARGCIQTLQLIPNGEFKRNINGELIFIQTTCEKKYKSSIECTDINSISIDNLWIGKIATVGCIQTLWQTVDIGTQECKLIRRAAPNSINALTKDGNSVEFVFDGTVLTLTKKLKEVVFVSFRPILEMYIIDFSLRTDEWGMNCMWKMLLEEV